MTIETGKVTFQGNPLTLIGKKMIKVGDVFPDSVLFGNDLSPNKIKDTKGVKVVTTVPSLDTPICDLQVKRFNQEAANLGSVSIFAVSADLPFAQARWCGGAGIEKVKTLSDYQTMALAEETGLLVKELRLFARTVIVLDADNKVTYMELVPEIAQEPDYAKAIEAIKKLI